MSEVEGPRRSRRIAERAAVEPKTEKAKVAKAPAKAKKAAPKPKKEESKEQEEEEELLPEEAKEEPKEELKEAEVLEEGDEIPNVTLKNQDDKDVNVFELSKTKPVVLFAYPKASTPGCTRQACSYRDEFEKFSDAHVFGISKDTPAAQLKFKTKNDMQFDLLSDPKFQLLQGLGGHVAGKVVRSQWVIKDGKIVSKTVKISPEKSVSSSLEGLKE
ncbi:peroxiredoxin Dot5p [Trichomonascus vanleenenianus]|uniref:thioredoxin peroxidase DOT5 n=1 Tax=Trichomonascus vanleenenianus TaxID=2268995 RepID=UPI003EC9913F